SHLDSRGQIEARKRFLAGLARQADPELGRRYRIYRSRSLIERYYSKAKKKPPTKKQVLVKAEERTLVGFFGGDWLALLDYLSEEPAEGEQIVTSLPTTRLFAGGSEQARLNVLKRFWTTFDELHAQQAPGMPSLWGLVEEGAL